MRCERCGRDFAAGLPQCPSCGAPVHYGGKTEFYGKAAASRLSVGDLFSDAFKKHAPGAGARMFMAGTPLSTPSPDRMLQEWDKPWLFVRVLIVGLLFDVLSYFLTAELGHPLGVYLLITLGALVVPLGILIFYWEINIPRDIPIYTVMLIFFIGGILSLVITLMLPSVDGPVFLAPLTEEPAKVIALAIFVYLLDCRYIFGGLLVGAAVGAGFSAFENIYYVVSFGDLELLISRSLLTIGGHVTWAALEGGALVMAKGSEKLQSKHFLDPRFLVYLAISMGLHCVWNSAILFLELPYVSDLKFIILCAAAVYAAFTLINKGISQVLAVADSANFRSSGQISRPVDSGVAGQAGASLTALSGPLAGANFFFQRSITLGRDPAVCNVILPADTPGVSRCHCTLEYRADGVYLMDKASSAGTFFQSGRRLPANQWVKVTENFYLGSPAVTFSVKRQASA